MSISAGTRFGVFEVVGLIGAGGMGEVYRASDTRLDRDVALKVLPDIFALDPERLARFEREAKVLASLNHPHIASIYGLEIHPSTGSGQAGAPALAMEMVEGQTLAERLATGPLPLDEALAMAKQIALALEHAHERGIVHRDLKPANIKVTLAGSVKVLDFGLARAMTTDASSVSAASAVSSPTITSPMQMTRAGTILGTAAYMAPEQARGKTVDQRADIWAFGCVLFEMLTSSRAFPGDEMADVLARVIEREPEWEALPATTPRSLKTLLQRCLRKDPARRVHSIADVRLDLEEVQTSAPEEARASLSSAARGRGWPRVLLGAAAGAAVTAAALLTLQTRAPAAPRAPVLRYSVSPPDGWSLFRNQISSFGHLNFAVSPDGEKIVAVLMDRNGARRLWLRRLDETAFREIPDTQGAQFTFWAPDSERIGFGAGTVVRQTSTTGATSRAMATLQNAGLTFAWADDDTILVSGGGPIRRWSGSGGKVEAATQVAPGVTGHWNPWWLPSGRGFLHTNALSGGRFALVHQSPTGAASTIMEFDSFGGGSVLLHYRSGHLLLTRADQSGRVTLTAQPFVLDEMRLSGQPTVLVTDVNPVFSASDHVLVFAFGGPPNERLIWVDATGKFVSNATGEVRPFNFDLSPDERFIAIQLTSPGSVVVHDIDRGVMSTLLPVGGDPIWSPDGRQIAYAMPVGAELGIWVIPAFGGQSRQVFKAADPTYPDDWSQDGKWLAGLRNAPGERQGILIPLDPNAQPIVFAREAVRGIDEPRFSPDGKWIAYGVTSGPDPVDVFLVPNPPTGERWQVSVAGGAQPRWRADGKAIYFLSPTGTMMVVDVRTGTSGPPDISAPRALFETGLQVNAGIDQYAVGRDGTRFLLRRKAETAPANQLQVIVNWPGLLDQKQPRRIQN